MKSVFFSVVVPVYNVEKYLDECIKSVLQQSFSNFELILVDDGAKDSSPAICDKYAETDGRVKVIHKQNGGLSDARNVGTECAKGEYVIYIDSDDYVADIDFMQKIYNKAVQGIDVICYKFKKYFEEKGEMADCNFSCPDIERIYGLANKINEMVRCDAFYCSAWSKAIRLEIIKKNNISFERGLLGEDQEWYYHVLTNVRTIDFIDEAFLVYRQRANSITSSWKMKNLTDCIYVVKKWSAEVQKLEIENEYKTALLNSIAKLYCNLLIAYTRFADSAKSTYYREIKDMSGLLKYNLNPRVNVFDKVNRFLGFNGLIMVIQIICKLR